jgi:lipopolysaccharide export system permease protein
VRILNRYVLREHVGPFLFAVTALTSLMLLQYIARQFGNLVGKGLGWQVILEFFLLSIPFTVEMTLPMAVLVAVLYAFSRLGAENEVTALKAGGVSPRSLMNTVLVAATILALGMLVFNDQGEPRTNHRLATLQLNIAVTKPTFALREQVINEVQPERLYLRSGHIDEATSKLHDVTIYDVADPTRRRTIIADSGRIALAPNMRDIMLTLNDGYMLSVPSTKRGELDRLYFKIDHIRVKDVASQFEATSADSTMKGDREMTICEMQHEYSAAAIDYRRAQVSLAEVQWAANGRKGHQPAYTAMPVGGIGAVYCTVTKWIVVQVLRFGPKPAHAADLASRAASLAVGIPMQSQRGKPLPRIPEARSADVTIQQAELERARIRRDRYALEIHKKFSLAAVCVVFALIGAPIALRFPRGGVGLVIGISFTIFALFYVGLTAGESLSDNGIVSPFWAMWAGNIVFLAAGLILYARMGHEGSSARGGNLAEFLYALRLRINRRSQLDAPS